MKYFMPLYNSFMDWLEKYELQVVWFMMGVMTVTIFIMLLSGSWFMALFYGVLTAVNFYLVRISKM
jgi:hypothetical protein